MSDDWIDPDIVAHKGWDGGLLRRLLIFARPHAREFAKSIGVLSGVFVCALLGPWIWKCAIDGPLADAIEARATGGDPDMFPFLQWIGAYVVVVVASMVLHYFQTAQLLRTGQLVIHDLRTALFRHMHRLDLSFFDATPTGSLVTRVTTDIENLNELFTSGLVVLLFDSVKILITLGLLFTIDPLLAAVVVGLTPVMIAISIVFRGGARRAYRTVRARLAAKNGYFQEVLSGIRVVQIFRREGRVKQRFDGYLERYLQANLRTIFLFAIFFPILAFVVNLIQASTIWVGGSRIVSGELTYGEFIQFWFYLAMFVAPIRDMGERYNVIQSAFASAERIFQVIDTQPEIDAPQNPRALPTHAGIETVRFEGVSFAYTPGREVIEDVSFEIQPGKTLAIVGATGSGKSTLVSLLLRFHDPSTGRITHDGNDLREYDPRAWRARTGLVLQEDYLFAGTVRENLVMGRERVSDASLARAIQMSSSQRVLDQIEGGLDGEVAERGATFSTGERQLLAIARALAADPALVILDEATASVDSATEAAIEKATRHLLEGRSALVVAHRLSTIRRADEILVLHHGQVHERGRHAELLALGGLYAKLHALQFGEGSNGSNPG
jgi:ATP-binding cassette subfamily B protein